VQEDDWNVHDAACRQTAQSGREQPIPETAIVGVGTLEQHFERKRDAEFRL
jgi:hypothetical protein